MIILTYLFMRLLGVLVKPCNLANSKASVGTSVGGGKIQKHSINQWINASFLGINIESLGDAGVHLDYSF
jgi:hypothetical protein